MNRETVSKLNGKTPAVALVIALASLIPAITGLVTAMNDKGEEGADLVLKLMQQEVDTLRREMDRENERYAKEIADLEEDTEQLNDRLRTASYWLLRMQEGAPRVASGHTAPSSTADHGMGKKIIEGVMEGLAKEDVEEQLEEAEEDKAAKAAPPVQQTAPRPKSLVDALRLDAEGKL